MATDFGTDVSTFPDLDFIPISGQAAVGEAVARRLMTPRGSLPFLPNYGTDIRNRLNDTITPEQLASLRSSIEAEAEKDERVERAEATVTYLDASHTLLIALKLTTGTGPFDLVLRVSQLSVELLAA